MTRTALVTGSSRGIGRAIATALAADGVDVVGIHYGSDRKAAEATASAVGKAGALPVLLPRLFGSNGVVEGTQLGQEFLDAIGALVGSPHVDVLVNNAGINGAQDLGDVDEATYRRVVETNLTAPLFLIQTLAPHLSHGGRVVNVSTGYTRIAAPTHLAYSATKGALNALTLALAPAFGPREITVNAVMPGVIDTDINAGWIEEPGARDAVSSLSVFDRVGAVEDVADVVRFLASDSARWITGQVIDVTGGSHL